MFDTPQAFGGHRTHCKLPTAATAAVKRTGDTATQSATPVESASSCAVTALFNKTCNRCRLGRTFRVDRKQNWCSGCSRQLGRAKANHTDWSATPVAPDAARLPAEPNDAAAPSLGVGSMALAMPATPLADSAPNAPVPALVPDTDCHRSCSPAVSTCPPSPVHSPADQAQQIETGEAGESGEAPATDIAKACGLCRQKKGVCHKPGAPGHLQPGSRPATQQGLSGHRAHCDVPGAGSGHTAAKIPWQILGKTEATQRNFSKTCTKCQAVKKFFTDKRHNYCGKCKRAHKWWEPDVGQTGATTTVSTAASTRPSPAHGPAGLAQGAHGQHGQHGQHGPADLAQGEHNSGQPVCGQPISLYYPN